VARRKARELAFRTLFEAEQGKAPLLEVWQGTRAGFGETVESEDEGAYGDRLDSEGLAFAERLLEHFEAHRGEIDSRLGEVIEGWSFSQMAQTDLTVLRLALTEILHEPSVPFEVTAEMAVRIAKKFGGEESGRFVNGVLATYHRRVPARS
jgi:N utilization substance protein B